MKIQKNGIYRQKIYIMYYDGGPLINDSETRTELAESEITKINQALIQYDPAVEDEKQRPR